ncbi:AbiV family abortive infection protein [uncultured Winogradskyella sp.]|uniref:AbiV family abortive infection protein n=1 Tax=uncultured Winogradskyella sp. TaxID=395353 RepID=UPI00262F582C|nr:AbiV family abortive infection protein [uncultured Winogradskyella sp.]
MRKQQYNQKLTLKKAAEGILIAIENSKSLLADANLLYDNERYERATALAILAIEENGKPKILREILLEDDQKKLKAKWQEYRRHTEKNNSWIVPELISKGARHLYEMQHLFDEKSPHRQELDYLKQLAFYTEAFSKCEWSNPKNVINKETAEYIISIATVSIKHQNIFVSEKELEIWYKHMKPVWNENGNVVIKALINCMKEAEDFGYIAKGYTEKAIKFYTSV